ncbi:MAG TPA: MOSC domain-containing protein [Acidimicrobiales bacterium]
MASTSSRGAGDGLRVVAVFVGRPRVIGQVRGELVESGIAKSRVDDATLRLSETNLAGDRQADLSVHGGPDKAVYVYPSEHYVAWQEDGFTLDVGGVGENVALAGATEHDVRVGDVWRWGTALVQVSQPRAPCFKLALHAGRKDIGPRMIATGRCGWYLRVLAPGTVPTGGPLELVERDERAPTVHDAFTAVFGGDRRGDGGGDGPGRVDRAARHRALVARVLAAPALAAAWRQPLVARHGVAS